MSIETNKNNGIFSKENRGVLYYFRAKRRLIYAQPGLDDFEVYGSSLASYDETFAPVLSEKSIMDLVNTKEALTVIDFMSPIDTVAEIIRSVSHTDNKLGIAVSLEDRRSPEVRESDRLQGIEQIAGDLARTTTWKELEKTLQGRKVSLIMERAIAGLNFLPEHPSFYGYALRRSWSMLDEEGGTMLIQAKQNMIWPSIQEYVSLLQEHKIDAVCAPGTYSPHIPSNHSFDVVRITKSPQSPNELPLLKG